VLATQAMIDGLADRIERAYCLRRAHWHGGCSTDRVWTVAATELLQIHDRNPGIPLDPELYVASQPATSSYCDPWVELTRAESGERYRRRVGEIVRSLKVELTREVRHAEERIAAGRSISRVLTGRGKWISALGRFIVARRAGRTALAQRFVSDAIEQHRSCPLYREASAVLIAPGDYPVTESGGGRTTTVTALGRRPLSQVPLN